MCTRALAVLAMAATALIPAQGQAFDYDCTAGGGSASNPHIMDDPNDYYSVIEGRGPSPVNGAMGDVHGPGIDLINTWVSPFVVGTQTRYRVSIEVGNLAELVPNRWQQAGSTYTFVWQHDVGNPDQAERYVDASINHQGTVSFSHGYYSEDPQTGLSSTNRAGSTTGSLTAGSPGVVEIVLPFHLPSVGKPTKIDAPYTRSMFSTVAFLWYVDEAMDVGPCFEITL